MFKMRIIMLVSVFALLVTGQFYGQEESLRSATKIVSGKISSVDWVGSKIAMRWYDPGQIGFDEITFVVTRQTKIIKGTEDITLADLNMEDSITVEYVDNGLTGLMAVKISVNN